MKGYKLNLIGQVFGKLTVVSRLPINEKKIIKWECLCFCGKTTFVSTASLRTGGTKSCGCQRNIRENPLKKGSTDVKKRLFYIWRGMKSRCFCKSHKAYKDYGGRGISVCEEWETSFSLFMEWALSHGYGNTLQIDRIDNNDSYSPSNCRFVTARTNLNNKRNSLKPVTFLGITKTIVEWAAILNMSPTTLDTRINDLKWDIEKAILTRVYKKRNPIPITKTELLRMVSKSQKL